MAGVLVDLVGNELHGVGQQAFELALVEDNGVELEVDPSVEDDHFQL